jgi:hypothetical protein
VSIKCEADDISLNRRLDSQGEGSDRGGMNFPGVILGSHFQRGLSVIQRADSDAVEVEFVAAKILLSTIYRIRR